MNRETESANNVNPENFRCLVEQFRGMALAVAYDRLRDVQLAEDAVQEAFLEAFRHLSKLEQESAFPGWFKRIVERQCARQIRRKRHSFIPIDQVAHFASSGRSVQDLVEEKERRADLYDRIAGLPPKMRISVWLFYIHGYSLPEISAYLGTPVAVLKKRLHDARRKLKAGLPVNDVRSVISELYEGGRRMLHIVNGDSVGNKLKQGVVDGEVLVWREIYTEGPVFADDTAPELHNARADDLERSMGIPRLDYVQGCEYQEQRLARFRDYDEVVLWFEHDLFDQTMLCCLLHWFSRQPHGRTKLSLLCIGSFPGKPDFRGLGELSVQQMQTLSGTWQPISREELELGAAVWEAYCAPDPLTLTQLLDGDTSKLPFVRDAFRFHLSRFPSVANGLGIVEQWTLERVNDGVSDRMDLFREISVRTTWLGMGDTQFWSILRRLSQGRNPLLNEEENRISLTDRGLNVMRGQEDALRSGIGNYWLGGVHVDEDSGYRWDPDSGKLKRL